MALETEVKESLKTCDSVQASNSVGWLEKLAKLTRLSYIEASVIPMYATPKVSPRSAAVNNDGGADMTLSKMYSCNLINRRT